MKRCFLGIMSLTLAGLVMGQGCPSPVPTSNSKPTIAGLYVGEYTCNGGMTLYLQDGSVQQQDYPPVTRPISRMFDDQGRELTAQDTPVAPGDGASLTIGPATIGYTVQGVGFDGDTCTMDGQVAGSINDGMQAVAVSGTIQTLIQLQADGTLIYSSTLNVGTPVIGGEMAILQQSCSGVLTR